MFEEIQIYDNTWRIEDVQPILSNLSNMSRC